MKRRPVQAVRRALRGLRPALLLSLGVLTATSLAASRGVAGPVPDSELSAQEQVFLADLTILTRHPHRLSGTEFGAVAARHIETRLAEIGVTDVFELDMPVWQERTREAWVEASGRRIAVYPLRPNVVVPPATPAEGVTGRLFYAGRGGLAEFGSHDVQGAIVVLEYDCFDGWERAFELGARAVIFVGDGTETPSFAKHVGVPSNLLRFYVPRQELEGIDLESGDVEARLVSRVAWERRNGRNIIARVRGTDPDFVAGREAPEALVLAASFDSFGVVPELSPGAREAANVAALLEAATRFLRTPPKRDVLFVFLDNRARAQQGAREVYFTFTAPDDVLEQQASAHRDESAHLRAMRALLERDGLEFAPGTPALVAGAGVAPWLERVLAAQADYARDDVKKVLAVLRLGGQGAGQEARYEALASIWDELRRALHEGSLARLVREKRKQARGSEARSAELYPEVFKTLVGAALQHFDRRQLELERALELDAERAKIREALGFHGNTASTQPVLHVDYSFGDASTTWGVVVGDYSAKLFPWRATKPEGDTPGYYGRVLNAFSEVVPGQGMERLARRTLSDPSYGLEFAPKPFVSSGAVAGGYGVYNVAFMTGSDARARDGHPADDVAHLSWKELHAQAREGTELLLRLASSESISLPPVFKALAKTKLPSWSEGQSSGDYAGLVVSGGLAEDRPAAGALMALWPGTVNWRRQAWSSLGEATAMASFEPIALEPADENGHFSIVGFREDLYQELMTLGGVFDADGRLLAASTTETQAQRLAETMRVNLFSGRGGHFTASSVHPSRPETFKLIKASSDGLFRDTRALWGTLDGQGFFYISDQLVDYRVKLFQPMGPVALGKFDPGHPFAAGVSPELFRDGLDLSRRTARDLWQLNETRLEKLRRRGVTSADLELLHGRARRAADQAERASTVLRKHAGWLGSAALSQRVYLPLRATMDDLVHAIVLLLLLAIPFAFSMERLLVCATGIYGRIAGFTLMFLATFGLLFWLHPGFAIASTPVIVFLAFAIVLLSSLVIYIVVRKFKTEIRAIQGQSIGVHEIEVSRTGTLLAAVGMGMSTMRRRPTRTVLTAVTVVVLSFTILSFASFSRTVGVRSVYEGSAPGAGARGLLVRKLDYSEIERGVLDLLQGSEGRDGLIAAHYWLVRKDVFAPHIVVARADGGPTLSLDAVLGVPPEELARFPALAGSFAGSGGGEDAFGVGDTITALRAGGVFLPAVVKDVLKLTPGQDVLLDGRRVRFAGVLDAAALQRVRQLDGQSVLPVDFEDPASATPGGTNNAQQSEDELLMVADAERRFVHLGADQIAVASAERVRGLGGGLHAVTLYPDPEVDVAELGRRVAEMVVMPVWAASPGGVERLILTVLTEVSGGFALFVPLMLGGLIIFGTLLGSISDREREIYTFSALGLAPGHIGALFFAEAAVYAVVGGMGGQLLAELVGVGTARLARAGVIQPTSVNYSSTNSLFALGVVMATVLVSAVYPAYRASKSANPGLARSWKMPPADGDRLDITFPFTVSAYDITGVVSFLAEHFRRHDDAGLGDFAARDVALHKSKDGDLELGAKLALAPFDLGVTQSLRLTAVPSEIESVDEVKLEIVRNSGSVNDWYRLNRVFVKNLRRQFLLWRTLSTELVEQYRLQTLEHLGELGAPAPARASEAESASALGQKEEVSQ